MKYKFSMAAAVIMAGLASSHAYAASECVDIKSSYQRLKCYDKENGRQKPDYAQSSDTGVEDAASPNRWIVREDQSKFDDSRSVYLMLITSDKIPGKYGKPTSATLHLRCNENETNAYIHFGGHFMADIQGYGRVRYRIDDDVARTVSMDESTNHESLGLWNGGSSIPFIKRMLNHDSMVVEATPFSESTMTMTFPIAGLEDAVKPLREACHW